MSGGGEHRDCAGLVEQSRSGSAGIYQPVLADGPSNPVFFAVTEEITGAVPGVAAGQGSQEGKL